MKTIIAGSRTIRQYSLVEQAVKNSNFSITEVLSGGANGVDGLGERFAKQNEIPCIRRKADWKKYRRSAGIRRNQEMVKEADALIAIWDGKSPGTSHVIQAAKKKGIPVYVLNLSLID